MNVVVHACMRICRLNAMKGGCGVGATAAAASSNGSSSNEAAAATEVALPLTPWAHCASPEEAKQVVCEALKVGGCRH